MQVTTMADSNVPQASCKDRVAVTAVALGTKGAYLILTMHCLVGTGCGFDDERIYPDGKGPDLAAVEAKSDLGVEGGPDSTGCGPCSEGMHCSHGVCIPLGMVGVPAGRFVMGCQEDECPQADSRASSSSWIPKQESELPFYAIDAREATIAGHKQCMNAGFCEMPYMPCMVASMHCAAYYFDALGQEYPALGLKYTEAVSYCEMRGKRLCTDAEWEKAARGTDGRRYPWGDAPEPDCEWAIMADLGADGCWGPYETGRILWAASPYGMLDALGNVAEWVSSPVVDNGPAEFRVVRGGSYGTKAESLSVSTRAWRHAAVQELDVGVRCCWSPGN